MVPPDYGALLEWSALQKQRYMARQRAGAGGAMRLDEQGIPLFSIELGTLRFKCQMKLFWYYMCVCVYQSLVFIPP